MLDNETIACLRLVLSEVCTGLSPYNSEVRTRIASRMLDAANRGDTTVEQLREIAWATLREAQPYSVQIEKSQANHRL